MADSPNARKVFSNDILYNVYRMSVWLNICSRTWEEGLRNATTVAVPELAPNVTVDNPTDADALVAAQSSGYKKAAITAQDIKRELVRATGSINLMHVRESGGGPQIEQRLNEETAQALALNLDTQIAAEVATASHFSNANNNMIKIGVTGGSGKFINDVFPYNPDGANASKAEILEDFADSLLNARVLLAQKNVTDNVVIGSGAPTSDLVAVMPYGLALNLVKFLRSEGELIDRSSIAGQAAIEAGIASLQPFMGRYAGIDIVASDGTGVATNSLSWFSYVVPSGSGALTAAAFPPEVDTQRYGDGTTEGLYEMRRTAIGRWAAKVLRPEHIVRIEVLSK